MIKQLRIWLCAIIVALSVMFPAYEAEAADYYTVIANNVASYNGNAAEVEWITKAILYACSVYQVDPFLVTAVMQTESSYNLGAISPVGAIGLMQLMPETAEMVGVDPYNPLENVIGGTSYLCTQLNNFSGWGEYGVTYAVAAYNAGGNAVREYGGVPPYPETINYVNEVARAYQNLVANSQW